MTTLPAASTKVPPITRRKRIPQQAIDYVVQQIIEIFQPQKIILFGSYAYGSPRAESDAEKYLKAFLFKNGVDFPKTHNSRELLELCLTLDASLDLQRDLLIHLDRYAVHYRYPGVSAEKEEARKAVHIARQFRVVLRQKLGLHD